VLLHRARRALASYDKERFVPDPALRAQSVGLLGRFMAAFAKQDVAGMEAMLADDVVALNDTNGRYPAAGIAVVGRNKVARFHAGVAHLREKSVPKVELHWVNGWPAMLIEYEVAPGDRLAPRFVTFGELDAAGRVRRIYSVLNPDKLGRVFRTFGGGGFSPSGTETPS
jgi:hypothetical protein